MASHGRWPWPSRMMPLPPRLPPTIGFGGRRALIRRHPDLRDIPAIPRIRRKLFDAAYRFLLADPVWGSMAPSPDMVAVARLHPLGTRDVSAHWVLGACTTTSRAPVCIMRYRRRAGRWMTASRNRVLGATENNGRGARSWMIGLHRPGVTIGLSAR